MFHKDVVAGAASDVADDATDKTCITAV